MTVSLLAPLWSAVLPIVAIAAVGYGYARLVDVDADPLAAVTLHVLLPALVFHSLATTTLGGAAAGRVAVGVVGFVGAMLLVSGGVARALGVDEPFRSALVLAASFPNSGNFGIPLSAFAFGAAGRTTAVLFVTVQNVLVYTVGAYVAARGSGRAELTAAREVLKLPLVYAAGAALLARWAGVVPPNDGSAMQTLALVGDASIPLMLLLVGIQLADVDAGELGRVVTPTVLKLGVAPVVGVGVVLLLGFENVTVARTFVLECATPAAVLPLVLTMAYHEDVPGFGPAEYVGTTILVTTVLGVVVLTALIGLLRAGIPL